MPLEFQRPENIRCFRNQLLVTSLYLIQEKALKPDLVRERTVEAKKVRLGIANQEPAVISPTIDCGGCTKFPMDGIFGLDAYSPKEIAERVENVGVTKTRLPLFKMIALGVLAGGFIGLGGLYFTLVTSDPGLGFAASRVLGGLSFCLGLILVVVAGAELFTGNNLLVMAWAARKISNYELIRDWAIVFLSNAIGAAGLAAIVVLSHHPDMNQGAVALTAVKIAAAKTTLPFWTAFFKGMLCNVLVCLAVWMAMAGRSVTDKVLAIVFPISAFVAAGFEHSIANLYFIPLGILLRGSTPAAGVDVAHLDCWGMMSNLVPVTLGNILGGSGMVALVYYLVYRRGAEKTPSR